jgi:hypothetical protein
MLLKVARHPFATVLSKRNPIGITAMFIVDLLTAVLLAVVLTFLFAGFLDHARYGRWRDLRPAVWLLTVGLWAIGIILLTLAAWIGHWVPFLLSSVLLFVVVFTVVGRSSFPQAGATRLNRSDRQNQMAVALYFSLTLLLFFCVVSLRFYFENLG